VNLDLGPRLLARGIDCSVSLLVFETLSLAGEPPFTEFSCLVLYPICSILLGQSLGKALCGLTVVPARPFRLVCRELILWALAPFVLLSLMGQRPLHDRLTDTHVEHG